MEDVCTLARIHAMLDALNYDSHCFDAYNEKTDEYINFYFLYKDVYLKAYYKC